MQTITTIGLDIAKSVFQIHGVDAGGQVIVRRQLKRRYVLTFFQIRPMLQNREESSCQSGAVHTWHETDQPGRFVDVCCSVKTGSGGSKPRRPFLTRNGSLL